MQTREERSKKILKEFQKEKNKKISKVITKTFIALIIIAVLIYLYMHFIGTRLIKTNEYVIKDSLIPSSFNGVKVVHISDIYYGNSILKDDLNDIILEINKINPDIVFFTGDLIKPNYQLNEDEINSLSTFFNSLHYRIGKYAVKGENDTSTFDAIMSGTNFTTLDNQIINIYNEKNTPICLQGININEDSELKEIDECYTITLIHNVDKLNNQSNLTFAGHNLRGEIYLFKPLLSNDKYNDNYYEIGNNKVYINNGLGTKNNVRLFNHPSISVYRLYNK